MYVSVIYQINDKRNVGMFGQIPIMSKNQWTVVSKRKTARQRKREQERKERKAQQAINEFLDTITKPENWRQHMKKGWPFCNRDKAKARLMQRMEENQDRFTVPGQRYHIPTYIRDGYYLDEKVTITFERRDFNGAFEDGNRVFIFYNPADPIFDRSPDPPPCSYGTYFVCPMWCPFGGSTFKLHNEYDSFIMKNIPRSGPWIHWLDIASRMYCDDIRIMIEHSDADDGWLNSGFGVIIDLADL